MPLFEEVAVGSDVLHDRCGVDIEDARLEIGAHTVLDALEHPQDKEDENCCHRGQ